MEIIFKPSPNFVTGRQGYTPIAIVIHIMEGTIGGTDSWFGSPKSQVSAHYGVGTNGEVHRYVLETNVAWHAGRVNNPTWKLIKTGGNGYVINPNLYTVGIEHEGDEHSEWTDEMYASSSSLIADISQRWGIPLDRDHIIGHHEIYSIKACPGQKVDFDHLIMLATNKVNPSQAVPGYKATSLNGQVRTICPLHIRKTPDRTIDPIGRVEAGTMLSYTGYTNDGENVSSCSKWYQTGTGTWFWAGGVIMP